MDWGSMAGSASTTAIQFLTSLDNCFRSLPTTVGTNENVDQNDEINLLKSISCYVEYSRCHQELGSMVCLTFCLSPAWLRTGSKGIAWHPIWGMSPFDWLLKCILGLCYYSPPAQGVCVAWSPLCTLLRDASKWSCRSATSRKIFENHGCSERRLHFATSSK
jgi:hypothetical protein